MHELVPTMSWLDDPSPETVAAALGKVAPWLRDAPIAVAPRVGVDDPEWSSSSAFVADRYVAKFAWAEPAARRLHNEIVVLQALSGPPPMIDRIPRVVVAETDPVLLVTERVAGNSGFEIADSLSPAGIGTELASFLAELHHPDVRARLTDLAPVWAQPAATEDIRRGLDRFVRADQRAVLGTWCDWVDNVLAVPGRSVVLHGDFHGNNQVWHQGRLRLVVDFETVGLGEPEYDFRGIVPVGPTVTPLPETIEHYQRLTGSRLSLDRVTAWHIRSVLGDALWRSEAGVALPDYRTVPEWVDDLAVRLRLLGIDP